MDTAPLTPNLTLLRVNGWQVYVWRDGDSVALIDTGAPGSGSEILSAVPGVDRIVLTHGHVDHCGSAAELHQATAAPVLAGAGDAAAIRTGVALPPPGPATNRGVVSTVGRARRGDSLLRPWRAHRVGSL